LHNNYAQNNVNVFNIFIILKKLLDILILLCNYCVKVV
jgi:hypothetical protein